jgi:hypothetical protein
MSDKEQPETGEPDASSKDDDAESDDSHLFGIDLGRRGDRSEQTSRDEVDVPPVQKVRAAIRTLTERLASAATDRDDAAKRAKPEEPPESEDDESGI